MMRTPAVFLILVGLMARRAFEGRATSRVSLRADRFPFSARSGITGPARGRYKRRHAPPSRPLLVSGSLVPGSSFRLSQRPAATRTTTPTSTIPDPCEIKDVYHTAHCVFVERIPRAEESPTLLKRV
uniref:Putative secreted mucin n=1 Tax=Amblyomma triste TaxID=251400 RepID=A0A023G4I6_AMBTT